MCARWGGLCSILEYVPRGVRSLGVIASSTQDLAHRKEATNSLVRHPRVVVGLTTGITSDATLARRANNFALGSL